MKVNELESNIPNDINPAKHICNVQRLWLWLWRPSTHLLVLVWDGNTANHHRLAGLLERCHPMNVESVAHPEREGLDLVLGLENVVASCIVLLGE